MKNLILVIFISLSAYLYAQPKQDSLQNLATVNVIVESNLKMPIENELVKLVSTTNNKSYEGVSNKNGKLQLFVPKGEKYSIQFMQGTSIKEYSKVTIPNTGDVTVDCKLTITPATQFKLDKVFFDTGKSSLKPESFIELDELVKLMNLKKNLIIEIAGHTDNTGNQMDNKSLSEERAKTVKIYLQKKGIDGNRVIAKGYGDSSPIADNSSEEGRKQNRRTEVKIIKQ